MGSVKISKALSPGLVKTYHRENYTSRTESYYSEKGDVQGLWFGTLAEQFGLVGGVTEEALNHLADGQHPTTGEQLVKWRTPPKPAWEKDDAAWSKHVEEVIVKATLDGRDLSTAANSGKIRDLPGHAPKLEPITRTERQALLIEMHHRAAEIYRENLAKDPDAQAYLASRGIKEETAAEFHVGVSRSDGKQLVEALGQYGPDLMEASGLFVQWRDGKFRDRFRDRLMFPIQDGNGAVIAFGARTRSDDDGSEKYINSRNTEIYRKGETLYGLHRATQATEAAAKVSLVEGYMDVIAAYQSGARNTVATCGTAMSGRQAETLKALAPTVVLTLDPDKAGTGAAKRDAIALLEKGIAVRMVALPGGKDPAKYIEDHGGKAYKAKLGKAGRILPWLIDQAKEKLGPKEAADPIEWKLAIAKELRSAMEHVSPELRPRMLSELSSYLGQAEEKSKLLEDYTEHRSAYDFTVAPHKSITAAAIVGRDRRLVTAHERAVERVMRAAEEYTQARLTKNGTANTGNLVAARFTHIVARPVGGVPDPHLHTHVVVFNMTDDNGKVRAVQPKEWYDIQRYLDAVYQAEMAVALQELGYRLDRSVTKAAAIEGYSKDYLDGISRRTTEIEKRKKELDMYGAAADHIIAHQSREAKVDWSAKQVEEYHRANAAKEFGMDPDAIPTAARSAPQRTIEPRGAHVALTYAKHTLSERTAVFDHYEVMEKGLRFGLGSLRLDNLEEAMDTRREEFREVLHYRATAPGHRYTTPEMLGKEREVMETVLTGQKSVVPLAPEITQDEFRSTYKGKLNDSQMWLSYRVLTCPDRIMGIQGGAGTGKTTVLDPTRQIIEEHGFEVIGVAPTGRAASELADAGITNSQTIQRFLAVPEPESAKPRVIFLDESSLASTDQVHKLFGKLRPQDRVILAGDIRQHQSVEAGRIFEQLQQVGMSAFGLRRIMRQRNSPELLKAVEAFSAGKTNEGLRRLDQQGWIHENPSQKGRYALVTDLYAEEPTSRVAVTVTNEDRISLDAAVQAKLRECGIVDQTEVKVPVLLNRQDLTTEDKLHAFEYEVGDVIRFPRRNKQLGVRAREYGTVEAIDRDTNKLTIRTESRVVECSPDQLRGMQVFVKAGKGFSVGDRIQFTQPWREKRINNRDTGYISYLDEHGNARVLLKKGRQVSFNVREMPHLDLAYAVTSYMLQSASEKHVLVHVAANDTRTKKMIDKVFGYVATSRAEITCQFVCDDKKALARTIEQLHLKPKAHSMEEILEFGKTHEKRRERVMEYAAIA